MGTSAPVYGVSQHYLGDKGKEYFAWQKAGGEFLARVFAHRFTPYISPNDTVVDFGCGGGFLLNTLTCAKRVGVEINPIARQHACNLGLECHETVDEVRDGIADVIISNHALEHVENPIAALRSLRKKLKANGRIVICVPIDNWRLQNRYDPMDQNHHLYTWTAQLLGNCLLEAGYHRIEIRLRNESWIRGWTSRLYNRLPYPIFRAVCYVHGLLTGKGRELIGTARPNRNEV
jgi:SAM-dependent methyltransferase